MRVSLDGVVEELQTPGDSPVVHADPDGLFGFPSDEVWCGAVGGRRRLGWAKSEVEGGDVPTLC